MDGKGNNKSVTRQVATKRDRAKHRCPENLMKMIDLVNSIPPDRKLPHLQYLYEREAADIDSYERRKRVEKMAMSSLQGVPASFIQDPRLILAKYTEFRNIRITLHAIAQLASLPPERRGSHQVRMLREEEFEKGPLPNAWREAVSGHDLGGSSLWQWPGLNLTINPAGRIAPIESEWLPALLGIEADRLRECPICQRIFWARQANMDACSSRCSNANRQRLYRERQSVYNQARKRKESESAKAAKLRK